MKLTYRLLTAIWAALIVFLALNFFWGKTGVQNKKQLQDYRNQVNENLLILENKNEQLQHTFENLLSDPFAIEKEARKLNLYYENEGVILLGQRDVLFSYNELIGEIAEKSFIDSDYDTLIRAGCISTFLICLIVSLLLFRKEAL